MQNQLFPDEILLKIFSYLNYPDLGRCAQVSKKMQSVCFDESLKYHLMIDAYQNYSPFIKVLLQVTNFRKVPLAQNFREFSRTTWTKCKYPILTSYSLKNGKVNYCVVSILKIVARPEPNSVRVHHQVGCVEFDGAGRGGERCLVSGRFEILTKK